MKVYLIMLICAATFVLPAGARIGETVETCEARYGEPVTLKLNDVETGIGVYDKNDITIKVHFTLGKVDLIRYSPGIVQRIDLSIARELLTRNGRQKEWEQLTDTEETIYDVRDEQAQHPRVLMIDPILWKSKDQTMEAYYSNSEKTLEVKISGYQEKILEDL